MPRLKVCFGDKEIDRYELAKSSVVIGREASCDLPIDNLAISRSHCRLTRKGDTYQIEDLKSANGTFVNGRKAVSNFYLNDGDEIVLGKYVLRFENEGQGKAAAQDADEKLIPDSVHTYTMDGDAIKQRIEKLRQDQMGKSSADPAQAVERRGSPAGAGARIEELEKRARLMTAAFGVSLAIALILLAVVLVKCI